MDRLWNITQFPNLVQDMNLTPDTKRASGIRAADKGKGLAGYPSPIDGYPHRQTFGTQKYLHFDGYSLSKFRPTWRADLLSLKKELRFPSIF